MFAISGFLRCINEIFVLLGFYAAQISSLIPTFRDYMSVLSPGVLNAASLPRRANI